MSGQRFVLSPNPLSRAHRCEHAEDERNSNCILPFFFASLSRRK
jgi:hypothetical protein